MVEKKLLLAMVGLPRSGKSTMVAQLSKQYGAPIVRRDAIRLALHGMRYKGEAEPMVKAVSLYMIRSLFLAGHDMVICDETNYSRAARDYIKSPDWETKFMVVNTSPEVCKERAIATGQPDLISVIDDMYKRYEPLGDDEQVAEYRSNPIIIN
jgi:tRNA uridine 5-carbamoylmethylation protein Kti12